MTPFQRALEEIGLPHPGYHPMTNEWFVTGKVDRTREVIEDWYAYPPAPPERHFDLYDDDDNIVGERVLNDDEWRAAVAKYEKAMEEWNRTGGVHRSPGPTKIRAHFETSSGAWAEMVFGGGEWHLREAGRKR